MGIKVRTEILMSGTTWTPADLDVYTWGNLPPGVEAQFKAWITAVDPKLDNEFPGEGPGSTWEWVTLVTPRFTKDGPWTLKIWADRTGKITGTPGTLIATGSVVVDDRDCLANNGLLEGALGVVGLLHVLRGYRDMGLGTMVREYLDAHLQAYVDRTGQAGRVYLFTEDPGTYLRDYGFTDTGINIPFGDHEEDLLAREYRPETGA
jgi:hypothetical protein